jgi:branched-chain amino acid transport system substrate-binding protein
VGVVAAGGIISSDAGVAASRVAETQQVPLFLGKAGSHRILTPESRYTFRTCLPAGPTILAPVAAFIEEEGLTRVGSIIADYEWGHSLLDAFETDIVPLGGVETQTEVAPVPEDDFTTYLRSLEQLDPEMVVMTGHPPGASSAIRQAAELGIDAYFVGPYNPGSVMVEAVGEAVFDRYVDSTCADYEDPEYHELATRYYENFSEFMELDAIAGYATVYMIAEAIEATGGPDPAQIADYVRTNQFDPPGFAWTIQYSEAGELVDPAPLLTILREGEPPEGVHPGAAWYPEILFRPPPLPTYEPEG